MRVPVAAEGWPFILPPAAAACIMAAMGWAIAAAVFAVVALAFLGFFRDPDRTAPELPGAVLAPADGRVMVITEAVDPWVGPAVRVSIFLSPLDVHVNRVLKEMRGNGLITLRNHTLVIQKWDELIRAAEFHQGVLPSK